MAQHNPPDPTDYSLHTDEQLREAITKIDNQEPRVESEDSDAAVKAAQRQRQEMQQELNRRESS